MCREAGIQQIFYMIVEKRYLIQKILVCILPILINTLIGFSTVCGQIAISKVGDHLIDHQALTLVGGAYGTSINGLSFQQDMINTHLGWQYVAYYNGNRHVCIARRLLPAGNWQIIEFTDYYFDSNDAHNTISIGICPNDGTIHLAFDHHGHPLHYRISVIGAATSPETISWEASVFGPVRNYLETGKSVSGVTYPRFWQTPAGDLQMSYRIGGSGNGDMCLVDYSGLTHRWDNSRLIISRKGVYTDYRDTSISRNPYMNAFTYDSHGRLHATWCWREQTQWANHDILYSYSDDGGTTWYNNNVNSGVKIQTDTTGRQTLLNINFPETAPKIIGYATGNSVSEKLIDLNSQDSIVVPISRKFGLMNQQTQDVDPWGQVHIVMWHCTDESYAYAASQGSTSVQTWGPPIARRYYHYWRDKYGNWHHNELPEVAGNRPKLFIKHNGDAILAYVAAMGPLPTGSVGKYSSGDLVILAASAAVKWTDWKYVISEEGPFCNEVQGDRYRFIQEEILSVNVQGKQSETEYLTPLRIIDFDCSL